MTSFWRYLVVVGREMQHGPQFYKNLSNESKLKDESSHPNLIHVFLRTRVISSWGYFSLSHTRRWCKYTFLFQAKRLKSASVTSLQILCSIFRASWINLSRNNQQMSCHSTLFPVNSLHVSDTFRVHHQEINKMNCICNLWYGNSIMRPAGRMILLPYCDMTSVGYFLIN
jgi:hypothetical protein